MACLNPGSEGRGRLETATLFLAVLAVLGCGLAACGRAANTGNAVTAPEAFPDVSTMVSSRHGSSARTTLQWRASTDGRILFSDSITEPCVGALASCTLAMPSALALPAATGTDVLVQFQPGAASDEQLVLRMHRRDGRQLWAQSFVNASLIGAADLLGTGRPDVVVVTGPTQPSPSGPGAPGDLMLLNEVTGETLLDRPLPPDVQTVSLAPSLKAGSATASVVLVTDDYGPPRRDDIVTALDGPSLDQVWATDLGGFPPDLGCCGFGSSSQDPSGSSAVYVAAQDPARDLTGDGIPELLMSYGHGALLMLDGATGAILLDVGGGPTEEFFIVRTARPGQLGLVAFTGEQYPSDLGYGLWVYDGTGHLVWHTDKLGGSIDVGDISGDGSDAIATVEFDQFTTPTPGRPVILDGATGRPLPFPGIAGNPLTNQFLGQLGPITLDGHKAQLIDDGQTRGTFSAYNVLTGRRMWQADNPGTVAVLSTQRCGLLEMIYYDKTSPQQPIRPLVAVLSGNGRIRWLQGPDGSVQAGPAWAQTSTC